MLVDSVSVSPLPEFLFINSQKSISGNNRQNLIEIKNLKHFRLEWESVFPTITRLDSAQAAKVMLQDTSRKEPSYRLSWNEFFPTIDYVKPKTKTSDSKSTNQNDKGTTSTSVALPESQPQRNMTTVTIFWNKPEEDQKAKRSAADEQVIFQYFMKNLRLDTVKSELIIKHFVNENPFNKEKTEKDNKEDKK